MQTEAKQTVIWKAAIGWNGFKPKGSIQSYHVGHLWQSVQPDISIASAAGLLKNCSDPRFARNVGNVVVEFGDASAQGIIDRYVDGQHVPYTELRKIWTDTVGYTTPPFNLGYVNFFAQARATNLSLPPARRIHVWLGDPPVDWSKAKKREDVVPRGDKWFQFRDNYAADLIERQILSRGRKASRF